MEAVLMNSSGDYKPRIGNPRRNFGPNRPLFSHPSDNLLLATFLAAGGHCGGGGGLLSMPPPSHLSHSYPPAVSVFRSQNNRQQPPLLPLPIPMPLNHHNNINISRSNSTSNNIRLSSPRINKVSAKNRVRDHSLTPKKSKNQKKDSKKEEADLLPMEKKEKKEEAINQRIGPDPKDLPKAVVIPRVFSSSSSSSANDLCDIVSVDKFSGSVVFTPSPPPSSLPLPTFSLRPKLSCKAEAAAIAAPSIDAGATDSLRRLLRLR